MIRTAVKFGLFVLLCTTFLVYLASTIGNTTVAGLVGQGEDTMTLAASFEGARPVSFGDEGL